MRKRMDPHVHRLCERECELICEEMVNTADEFVLQLSALRADPKVLLLLLIIYVF